MIQEMQEWVSAHLPTYKPFIGQWEDSPALADEFMFAVQGSGGTPQIDTRYDIVRLLLLGPRNGRQHQLQVLSDANLLINSTMVEGAIIPCGAANLRALGGPVGPSLTTENRVCVSVPFQIIF